MAKKVLNVRDIKLEPGKTELKAMMFSNSSYLYDSYNRAREIITKMLGDIGICNISVRSAWISQDLTFEVPTLLFVPFISGVNKISSNDLQSLVKRKFNNISGWDFRMAKNFIYQPLDNKVKRLMHENIVVGDYYPERNLLIMNFNIFPQNTRLSLTKTACEFIIQVLRENNVEIGNKFSAEELESMKMKKSLLKFSNHISSKVSTAQNSITNGYEKINLKNKEVIKTYNEIGTLNVQVEALKKFKDNFDSEFEKKIDELRKLEFIKEVSLTEDGILLEVGNLSLGRGNDEVYIGYFSFLITPEHVNIFNKYSKSTLQHPHVHDTRPCFGTFSEGINKLLGEFDLKRLAVSLYQFLYTYNGRGCFGDGEIRYWRAFRTKEKKFDSKGGMIKDGKAKSKNKPNTANKA